MRVSFFLFVISDFLTNVVEESTVMLYIYMYILVQLYTDWFTVNYFTLRSDKILKKKCFFYYNATLLVPGLNSVKENEIPTFRNSILAEFFRMSSEEKSVSVTPEAKLY